MQLHESAENYLEAILVLEQTQNQVRSIDVVNHLGFSKPSVSVAMKRLREDGYVQMDGQGFLALTAQGRAIAEIIYERHRVIAEILIGLGVDEQTAYADACKIEHDISQESFQKMKTHYLAHRDK
ncbi:MAG: metal-dependent transcriptional regulator [Christensenellales bacterium]